MNVKEYHSEVLKLIEGLHEEFGKILKALNWPPMEVVNITKFLDNYVTSDVDLSFLSFNLSVINMEPANKESCLKGLNLQNPLCVFTILIFKFNF